MTFFPLFPVFLAGGLRTAATAWADAPISDALPSYYFEVTVLNALQDPSLVAIGFYAVGRGPVTGMPGQVRSAIYVHIFCSFFGKI